MSLFEELKRRRVIRLIAAYVLVAWVLIEVVTTIEEPLGLPAWFDTAVIVLLGLGFPIAVIMSWIYDVTPDGVTREDGTRVSSTGIDYGKIALVAVLILGAFLAGNIITEYSASSNPGGDSRPAGLEQYKIDTPVSIEFSANETRPIALTPDGDAIVLTGTRGDIGRLYHRPFSSLDVSPITGADTFRRHFALSPDGQFAVYYDASDSTIRKIPISGGISTLLAQVDRRVNHFSWGDDGYIAFILDGRNDLSRVSAAGGDIEELSRPTKGSGYKHVAHIPGSSALVFVIGTVQQGMNRDDRIAFLSADMEIRDSGIRGSSPKASSDGLLVFFRDGSLWAATFDNSSLAVLDEPKPIVNDVYYLRYAHFDISREGSLAYRRDSARGLQSLVWVDRNGIEFSTSLDKGYYNYPSLSPDGQSVAMAVNPAGSWDLWIFSLSQGTPMRLTTDDQRETTPIWSSDGSFLYFETGANNDLFRVSTTGSGQPETLDVSLAGRWPYSLSSDDKHLFISERNDDSPGPLDVGLFSLDPLGTVSYPVRTEFWESHPSISPAEDLLAYMSDRTGQQQIYIREYPETRRRPLQVSVNGGWHPRWNSDGTELFYWGAEAIMSVRIDTGGELKASAPVPLFNHDLYVYEVLYAYDYDEENDRFLLIKKPLDSSIEDEIVLVRNWRELLNRQAP